MKLRSLVVFALALSTGRAWAAEPPRHEVTVFRFMGSKGPAEAAFDSLRSALSDTIAGRLEQLQRSPGVTDVHLTDPLDKKPTDLLGYWTSQGSLELLSGTIDSRGVGDYVVTQSIYSGLFQGHLGTPQLSFRLPYQAGDADVTQNVFAAVTLYALALEEKRRGARVYTVNEILSSALETIKSAENDIRNMASTQKSLSGLDQVAKIRARIEAELRDLKNGTAR
jgi:hypothetical protein